MRPLASDIPTTLVALLAAILLFPAIGAAQPGNAPATLASRGFPGSTLEKTVGNMAIYRLGEAGSFHYFAVVRPLSPSEPILDFVEVMNAFGTPMARYGPAAASRFNDHIAPLVGNPRSALVTVVLYHYAAGASLERVPGQTIHLSEERHFATGEAIENPIAKEVWSGERRNTSMPFVWTGMDENRDNIMPFNTVAALQAAQQQAATAQQATTARQDALSLAEARDLDVRRARVRAREAEREQLITAAGLRYWPQETWDSYLLGPELKAVFDGSWPDAAREWEFGSIYLRTIEEYSERCGHLIPEGSPSRTTYFLDTDEFGRETKSRQRTTYIPVAFVAPFEWWDKRSPEALPLTPPGFGDASAEDAIATLATVLTDPGAALMGVSLIARVENSLREDMPGLFNGGCESPDLKQFMENMRRLALRIPTLQSELAPRSILSSTEWPMSIGLACTRHDQDRGAELNTKTCLCLEQEATKQMTLGERWQAVDDYHAFFDEVYGIRTGPDGRPISARDAVARACRR